jgi:hypothetical protein
LIGNLLISSSVGDHPTLEMFWGRIISIVPGADEKLGVDGVGSKIMEARLAVALSRTKQ